MPKDPPTIRVEDRTIRAWGYRDVNELRMRSRRVCQAGDRTLYAVQLKHDQNAIAWAEERGRVVDAVPMRTLTAALDFQAGQCAVRQSPRRR